MYKLFEKMLVLSVLSAQTLMLCAEESPSHVGWWRGYDLTTLSVIKVPVADMLQKSASRYVRLGKIRTLYQTLPLSCEGKSCACKRIHQCLMGDMLCESECGAFECSGVLPDAWYGFDENTGKPMTTFYTWAANTVSLKSLLEHGVSLDALPPPRFIQSDHVLALVEPWHDSKRAITYSAGTRFVRLPAHDNADTYAVWSIDFDHFVAYRSHIPKKFCLIDMPRSSAEKRSLFITILERWVNQHGGIIPYVLGGSSFVGLYDQEHPFWLTRRVWMRKESKQPHTGFDCSELIWRAASLAGISYFYKNTAMLARFLQPLRPNQSIAQGDLIWVPGHVMVISDITHNKLIEAAGYKAGYGKVQSLRLDQRFKNIATYGDLVRAYYNKQGLSMYSRELKPEFHKEFIIFKLMRE